MKQDIVVLISRRFRNLLFLVGMATGFVLAVQPIFASADPAPCSANSANRQFDFWLGDWTVTYPGAAAPSTSKVYLELDQCLLVESWSGGGNHAGKNMFAYSFDDKSWHGMFADNLGRVHVFEGKVAPGSAEFLGPSRGPNGQAVLNRIRVVQINPETVQQTWEKSSDNGASWNMEFRGEYSRNSH
jgi:hypothetical protein